MVSSCVKAPVYSCHEVAMVAAIQAFADSAGKQNTPHLAVLEVQRAPH